MDRAVPDKARIVDQDMYVAERLQRRADEPLGKIGLGDVARHGDRPDALGFGARNRLARGVGIEIVDDEVRAFGCEPAHQAEADPATATGDQSDLSVQPLRECAGVPVCVHADFPRSFARQLVLC